MSQKVPVTLAKFTCSKFRKFWWQFWKCARDIAKMLVLTLENEIVKGKKSVTNKKTLGSLSKTLPVNSRIYPG